MCGIAGASLIFPAGPVDGLEARLRHMNSVQQHRGPDGEGIWSEPRGMHGLAHVRLSIVDLERRHKPADGRSGRLPAGTHLWVRVRLA